MDSTFVTNLIIYFFLALQLIIFYGLFLFSLMIHEIAHALVAFWCGDPTAKEQGRISLNPLSHLDPIGSLALPVFFLSIKLGVILGYAKPVRICHYNFSHPQRDVVFVSLAGPFSNLCLALLCLGLYALIGQSESVVLTLFSAVLESGFIINALLMMLNLLPIPPLDGSHLLLHPIPLHIQERYSKYFIPIGIIVLIMVLKSGIMRSVFETLTGILSLVR